jgi:hypothetical protein
MTAALSGLRGAVILPAAHDDLKRAVPGHASATNGFVPSGQGDKNDVAS